MKTVHGYSKHLAILVAMGLMTMSQAEAALSTAITGAMTSIQVDGLALVDLVWPVVGALTGAFVLFKLFKRGTAKI